MPLTEKPADQRVRQFPVGTRESIPCFSVPTSVGQGTFTIAAGSPYYWGAFRFSSSPANGDNFSHSFFAVAGTYTVEVFVGKFTDCAILEVDLDGVSLGTTDCYNASQTTAVISYTAQVLTNGTHSITLKANGKNASASTYNIRASGIVITRTA